jgi:penicillin amidase
MATTTVPVTASRCPRWSVRILVAVVLFFAIILSVIAWLYLEARSALPQLDGKIVVQGLSASVSVIRDSHGVPTIEAASLEDLFFAQGYVTAQDRLWQMDVMRRFAAGEIAEILGQDFIKHDREQRILGLRNVARHAAETISPRDRVFFEAYARGVNVYIQSSRDRLPIEFRILRYLPRPWTVEDSLLIGARLVQDLNNGPYREELTREKILAKLGPELTADLYVNSSWRDRPPTAGPRRVQREGQDEDSHRAGAKTSSERETSASPMHSSQRTGDDYLLVPGSNNWVVSGQRTVSGKPLLSNDMHLGHQMPNLWYEAHLRCGSFDVAGVTLPGMPFLTVGRNQRIAWGFTNVGPTVEDIYVETFNKAGQYLTPQGWRTLEHREELIHVKNRPDVTVDVTLTRHGPIVTELVPGESRKLALRWTLYDSLRDPFFDVDSAQNWNQFRRALSTWDSPSQNAVYADVDGHIGYQATGHIPIRAAGDGSVPVSGSDNSHEWTGYVPFEKLPSVYDPPSGIIATANGRITPDGYPFSLSTEWGPPWRTERIYGVLESSKKFEAADMLVLQNDIFSAYDRFCAERFVYALDHAKSVSERARRGQELMREWDGRLTIDSAAATVERVSRSELARLLLEGKLGAAKDNDKSDEQTFDWKSYQWEMASIWMENILLKQPKPWLPQKYENYDDLLTDAVEAAVNRPAAPKDLSNWHWGKFSPIEIEHPVLSRLPLIGRWTGPGLREQSGGGFTVKQVGRDFGPSERLTVDLADLDRSTLNLVTGESGNFLSPYYMDQWQAWYEGFTFPLPFSPTAVHAAQKHQLELEPGK